MPLAVFKRGSKGPFVAEIQKQMNVLAGFDLNRLYGNGSSRYPTLVEDGKYGKKTSLRVKEFQEWNPPLKIDGKVGPNTWAKMTGKFWSPDVAKAATEAAPVVAAQPAAATTGHLYLLRSKDFEGEQASGKHLRRTSHKPDDCHYIYVKSAAKVPELMASVIDEENLRIKDLIIVGHGAGGGSLNLGDSDWVNFDQPNNAGFFKSALGHFAPGAIIWIYACSFATHRTQDNNTMDHDLVQTSELIYDQFMEGRGFKAMRNIADYTGCEVRAGLDSQVKNVDGFRAIWSKVRPGAARPDIYMNGRLLQSWGGFDTHLTEQLRGSIAKFVNFFN